MACLNNSANYQTNQSGYQFPQYDQSQNKQSQNSRLPAQRNIQTQAPTAITSGMPQLQAGTQTPTTVENPYYTAGFLKNFLGRDMRVEFLIGTTGALVDRVGTLVEVGASYIVLQPYLSDDLLMADLYSIKFVTIYG